MVCGLLRDPESFHEEVPLGSLKDIENRHMISDPKKVSHTKDTTYLRSMNESIVGRAGHEHFKKEAALQGLENELDFRRGAVRKKG